MRRDDLGRERRSRRAVHDVAAAACQLGRDQEAHAADAELLQRRKDAAGRKERDEQQVGTEGE